MQSINKLNVFGELNDKVDASNQTEIRKRDLGFNNQVSNINKADSVQTESDELCVIGESSNTFDNSSRQGMIKG